MASKNNVYSVSDLTAYLKHLLETDPILSQVEVTGEVSNLTYHRSGHVYFSLKDEGAQISCVMFRGYAQYAPKIQAGDRIIAKGGLSVYAPRGNYQLMVKSLRKEGVGDLFQQFVALKAKLEAAGWFSPERKQSIPVLPSHIAVVTSPTGAAIKDILQTIRRRYNRGLVTVIPTMVQGTQAAESIVRSLEAAERLQPEVDVIILGRGGGSLEDLWSFNEEAVARAIRDCPIPIVSGVGHETDFTIADFVADQRASTPTAAAEAVAPDMETVRYTLKEYERQLNRGLQYFIDFKRQILDDYSNRMEEAMRQFVRQKRHEVDLLASELKSHDQRQLLERGYTLTLKEGKVVRSAEEIKAGEVIDTVFMDGRKKSTVNRDQ